MSNSSIVPEKIYKKYIQRLLIEYKKEDEFFYNILKNIQKDDIEVNTGTGSETRTDYNGSFYEEECFYHTLIFHLPKKCFENGISLKNQDELCEKIKADLNRIITESNESIFEIKFELKDEVDIGEYLKNNIRKNDTDLKDITFWKPDCLRVFISHSSIDYDIAKRLKDRLIYDGISCFVVHKDIQPTTEWKKEIKKALNSMEVMFVLVTKDSNKSDWVDQEIGYALGQNIPIIPVKLDSSDPKGFMSDIQALTLNRDHIVSDKIYDTIKKIVGCIKSELPQHIFWKKNLLKAKDGTFAGAQKAFMNAIDQKYNDQEIEELVETIKGPAKTSINQLETLFPSVPISNKEHLKKIQKMPKKYKYYAELLRDKILSQHTQGRYSIDKGKDKYSWFKIIDNYQDKNNQKQDINEPVELPF